MIEQTIETVKTSDDDRHGVETVGSCWARRKLPVQLWVSLVVVAAVLVDGLYYYH